MEENVSAELSVAAEPEQSHSRTESCSQGSGKADSEQKEHLETQSENVLKATLDEPQKPSKASSAVKKTWGFRRSTVAKREMPVEAATDCPVRRSGRQSKRTDKLEEFLLTAKRGARKSAPPSLESGDPPSQTPTDAETASEASFDGNADGKALEERPESPERKTRSSAKKQTQRRAAGGRRTRASGGLTVKDEESSENEEDSRDAANKDEPPEKKEEKADPSPADVQTPAQPQPEPDSGEQTTTVQAIQQDHENNKVEKGHESDEDSDEDSDEESEDNSAALHVKRGPIRTYINKKKAADKNTTPVKAPAPPHKNTAPVVKEAASKPAQAAVKTNQPQTQADDENEDDSSTASSSSSIDSDEGGYDPNALYCICRQKHNKRFMICCDRCEEWFHGDCVGITEARGRLMERNGEDYICPNCTAKKNQVVRPATSNLSTASDKSKADTPAPTTGPAVSASSFYSAADKTSAGVPAVQTQSEEKAPEDAGIKGRIEKATNPTGKKKMIKIFQPAIQQAAQPKAVQKAAPAVEQKEPSAEQKAPSEAEQKVAVNVEVNTTGTADAPEEKAAGEASLPKCIGQGCERNAQPDSVYCGNDCILRHAAAAMRSITDVKEPKQKAKAQKTKAAPKRKGGGAKKRQKKSREESDSDEELSSDAEEEDEDEEHAEEQPPAPATASWSSDHNYIAVTPEKTTPISPTVLNKKSPVKEEKRGEKEAASAPEKPPTPTTATITPVKGNKKTSPAKAAKVAKVSPKGKKPSPKSAGSKGSKKPTTPQSKTAAKAKKASVQPPSPFPPGPIHVTGALRVTKSSFTIPKKQPQKDTPSSHSQSSSSSSSSSRVPPSPTSSSHSSSSRSSSHSSAQAERAERAERAPPPPPPNNQMRQNIRRSLTDILYKRVSDSDDLKMTESEVGRLAVGIEKEMFNICLSTDSKYKNKYRSLMFNLKDPKNKGLFYRVVGGEVSPFRLVRLSAEELLSKEISEWRKPDAHEGKSSSSRHHSGHARLSNRHDSSSHSVDMEEAPPTSDADVCISSSTSSSRMASVADQEESSFPPSASTEPSALDGNSNSSMPDIFGSMLKDTTAEHRTHLFDLNCKICTGQKTEEEVAAKKPKLTKRPESKSPRQEPQVHPAYQQPSMPPSYQSNMEPVVPESHPQLHPEELHTLAPPTQAPAPVIPAVSSVTITRRDPRMARHGSSVTVSYTAPEKPTNSVSEPPLAPVSALVEVGPKAPLPMPPAAPPALAGPKPAKNSTSESPPEGETAIFLHGQEKIWKGFVNMQSVAKFVGKAFLVSGSFEYLKEDLPDTIHVGGRIPPNTVWDYVGKLKGSLSKELCLIRFHPATEEEEVAYVSLFSYFSSRKRFGVVANNNRRIKDLYLIPLSAKDPLPSKLLPFDGPGLEPARPNLLLGLLICQKDRKRAGAPLETEEKRSKTQTKDAIDTSLPKAVPLGKAERSTRHSLEIPFSTTPPGSPPASFSELPASSAVTASSVFSLLSSIKAPATSTTAGKDSPASSSSLAPSAAPSDPLQTIFKTLFGKKMPDSEASNSPSDQGGELSAPPATMLDPIVQQFQISKEIPAEEDEDDRPYDPEEEYEPSRGYNLPKPVEVVGKPEIHMQPDMFADEGDDVAYDPEDDSIFENVKTSVPVQAKASTDSIIEPQKILESLKLIGNRTFHKQGEQQPLLTGTTSASLSLPDTVLPQPLQSLFANTQLLELGKKVEELVKSSSVAAPSINKRRDPRQSRDPRQAEGARKSTDEPEEEEEETLVPTTDPTHSSQPETEEPQPSNVGELLDSSSQGHEPTVPEEEVKSDTLPFLESDKMEVSIPLLGEVVEPDTEVKNANKEEENSEEAEPMEAQTELDKYSIWPNAASILKATADSDYEENSQDAPPSSYYKEPEKAFAVPSTIPVLTQSTAMVDTQPHHLPHHMRGSRFDNEYRPPADIPPPSNFPAPHSMQGQTLIMRPPTMSLPPTMQGLPPMSGPPPMQGPPPPHIHGPPPVRGLPPPMPGDGSRQYGPPPGGYPPFRNQWPGNPQQQPPPQQQLPPPGPIPQNIMPPRGPPLPFPQLAPRGPGPQMFDPSIPSQHLGQQRPPLSHPPPGQTSLPPPRFTGPPPPFNFPANRGPPPLSFTGPPPGQFDNRLPPPSHFPGPRGPPPTQYGDRPAQQPFVAHSRGPAEPYVKDNPNSFKLNVDQNPNRVHQQGPPPGPAYRGPPPQQYEDRRGPPTSGEMGGPHFSPHSQYGSSRPQSSPPHRGSFDEHRGPPPPESRPHPSQPFGGSERYRFDRLSDEARPVRHSGPLLPTPSEAPLGLPSRMGAHSPDLHRDDHWRRHSPEMRRHSPEMRRHSPEMRRHSPEMRRHSPEMRRRSPEIRRRSSTTREGSEPRAGDRFSRFEGGLSREPAPDPTQPSEERPRELSEDRRRDREVPPSGRPSWDRGQPGKRWSREQEWDRVRERDRDSERSRETDRDPERSREKERDPERSREKERDPERSREKERDPERSREKERDQERGREKDREPERSRETERDRERSRETDRERSREKERSRGKEGERHRDPEPERHRDKDTDLRRDRDRERDRPRDTDRRDHDRDRARNRERERDRDRERERERDKRRDRSRSKERDRDRDRGKDRGRDRDKDRERERDNKDRDKDREKDKDRDRRDRSRSRDKREEKKDSKHDMPRDSEKTSEKDKNKS